MAVKLNQHEKLARLSIIMAAIGGTFFVLMTIAILGRMHWETFEIYYSPKGMRFYAILGAVALAGVTTATGFFSGLSSAGQKRNKFSKLSWIGFFSNALIATLTLCLFAFFWFAKEAVG